MDEGNPDFITLENEQQAINLDKYARTVQLLQDNVKRFQTPFEFQPQLDMQSFLKTTWESDGEYDPDQLYQLSLTIEPREMKQDSVKKLEKTMDMLQKTGLL